MLVRIGPEIQEVSRPLTGSFAAAGAAPRATTRPIVHNVARLLLAGVIAAVLAAAWTSYRIWAVGQRDDQRKADVIVVLGAAQYNGRPSAILRARVDHAVDLYEQGIAPFLVVTGGKAGGDITTEAATSRTLAVRRGVPPSAILAEDLGRTTLESLQNVAALMHARGLQSAVLVSDRSHMLRVLRIARDQGITSYGSPTTTSPSDSSLTDWIVAGSHELGGLALYFVIGQTP